MSNIVDQSYWDTSYEKYEFSVAQIEDPVRQFISQHVPLAKHQQTCLEIGCFPGRYLAVFGEMGYRLSGIDLTPRIDTDLKKWFVQSGYEVDQIQRIGVEYMDEQKKYHIVCSFGFIEHFTNWEEIFLRHLNLVEEGGYLIVTVPNFRGFFQRMFHKLVDNENYERHVIAAMNTAVWKLLAEQNNFEVLFHGCFGQYDFWVDRQMRGFVQIQLLKLIQKFTPIFKKMPPNYYPYSPYCGIVAKKIRKA